jgi:hypothetical protein
VRETLVPAPRLGRGAADDLPTGVVTFLLTDIVGSTRLWEAAPAATAEALPRHDRIVNGRPTPSGAALAAQAALIREQCRGMRSSASAWRPTPAGRWSGAATPVAELGRRAGPPARGDGRGHVPRPDAAGLGPDDGPPRRSG